MKIETKFNKYKSVWVVKNNRVVKVKIQYIRINVADSVEISYFCTNKDAGNTFFEDEIFETKAEAVKEMEKLIKWSF